MDYRTGYLRTEWWRNFRRVQLELRPICEECRKAPATELHHRRYSDARGSLLFRERPSTVTAICRPCHDAVEAYKASLPKRRNRTRRRRRLLFMR
jgi:hypothetical protein